MRSGESIAVTSWFARTLALSSLRRGCGGNCGYLSAGRVPADCQHMARRRLFDEHGGRARKWLSREVDPLSITDRNLKDICDRLNAPPRKCLGYKTPAEIFRQKLLAQMRRAG